MRKAHLIRFPLPALFLLLAVTGCGFKGPLTLPPADAKQPAPATQPAPPADQPAEKK